MNSRYIWPLVRLVVSLVVAAFILINAKTYLLAWWGLSIPPNIYGVGGLLFFWIVVSLSMKRIVEMLKADARARQTLTPATRHQIAGEDYVGQEHMFPRRYGYLMLIFDVFLFSLPSISAEHGTSISSGTYFLCFGAGCIVAIAVVYIFRYRVTIKSDRIVIRTINTSEIPFVDIVDIRVITAQNIPPVKSRAVISLTNGKRIRFNGMLTRFNELVDVLTLKTSKSI